MHGVAWIRCGEMCGEMGSRNAWGPLEVTWQQTHRAGCAQGIKLHETEVHDTMSCRAWDDGGVQEMSSPSHPHELLLGVSRLHCATPAVLYRGAETQRGPDLR